MEAGFEENVCQRYSPEMGSGLSTGLHWIPWMEGCELCNLVYEVIKSFPSLALEGIQLS